MRGIIMGKMIKIGIAIFPLFIIGHLTQSWSFVLGGLTELFLLSILFYYTNKNVLK